MGISNLNSMPHRMEYGLVQHGYNRSKVSRCNSRGRSFLTGIGDRTVKALLGYIYSFTMEVLQL